MASSFGWERKRKVVSGSAAAPFKEDSEEDDNEEGAAVNWLAIAKKRKLLLLEDNVIKSRRLQEEGAILAENERYWEAVKYWNEALELTPRSAALHEMKSQVRRIQQWRITPYLAVVYLTVCIILNLGHKFDIFLGFSGSK